jgi:DNA helicase-2/ATP-dependent DNA helicase PcrA
LTFAHRLKKDNNLSIMEAQIQTQGLDEEEFSVEHIPHYMKNLNPQQREVVLATGGVHIVMAGPGSGKTRVICHRIAHLILQQQIAAQNIVLLTFTNKAAREMRERVTQLIGEERAQRIYMGTFHAVCARFLRLHGLKIGLSDKFSVCDEDYSVAMIKKIMTELKMDKEDLGYFEKAKTILQAIQKKKNGQPLKKLTESQGKLLDRMFNEYEIRKKQSNMLDFDDLILNTITLFETIPTLAEQYHHVFIDEVSYIYSEEESFCLFHINF